MSDAGEFQDLIARVRAGDESAAALLVRRYEPLIRREVRLRLEDPRLSRQFDSMDVCQSVLASFFVRAAVDEYDLQSPDQLVRLLVTMARNKLASTARKATRQRRDHRRQTAGGDDELRAAVAPQPSPSEEASLGELLARARQQLTAEEFQLAELRSQGIAWDEIAARMGGTAQARRMQLARAAQRVAETLGLDHDTE